MKKLAILSVFVLFMGFGALDQASASFTVMNDDVLFFNLPGNTLTENFQNNTYSLPGFSINEVNGSGTFHDGVYENIVDHNGRYQEYVYTPGMSAFGAYLNLTGPGGPGQGIDMYVNGTYILSVPNTARGEFYGFLSTETFYKVDFYAGNFSGIQETYYNIDTSLKSAVPLPGAVYLLGSGLLGLLGLRRRNSVV